MSEAKDNLESNKRQVTHYIQGIFNKIEGQFIIKNQGGQKAMGWHIQVLIKTQSTKQEFCIWQNYLLKMKEKLRHSQINNSWGNPLLYGLYHLCKKCWRESFRLTADLLSLLSGVGPKNTHFKVSPPVDSYTQKINKNKNLTMRHHFLSADC